MFLGSIPRPLYGVVHEVTAPWKCKDVYVGCSGNFTIERILAGKFRLHSNDVSIYSSALGWYFSGQDIKITLKDDRFDYFDQHMESPVDTLATILLASRATQGLNNPSPYYERMREEYKKQWATLHKKTVEKLEKVTLHLDAYDCEDVLTWIERVPEDAGVICYPPFFAKDYTNMFRSLDVVFDWQPPEYTELTQEVKQGFIEKLFTFKEFMVGLNFKPEGMGEDLCCIAKTTNRGVPIYVYSKEDLRRVITPHQDIEFFPLRHLGQNEEIGQNIKIRLITHGQFCMLRSTYMNHNIRPGQESFALAVTIDDVLIGVYAISNSPTLANWGMKVRAPTTYLLSDFPVANTKYKKLSKLILYAALSKESQAIIQGRANKKIYSIVTTAFTAREASMKYRSLFTLLNKSKEQDGKNRLNYGAALGKWTLQEGFDMWKKECL